MSTGYDLNFQVQLETDLPLPVARMQQAVEWVLQAHDIAPATGISVVITDDERDSAVESPVPRNVDAPTDVLSFPDEPMPGEDEPYLGDLILSAAIYSASGRGREHHTLSDELVLAVIHGTLHLLGYDHDTCRTPGSDVGEAGRSAARDGCEHHRSPV